MQHLRAIADALAAAAGALSIVMAPWLGGPHHQAMALRRCLEHAGFHRPFLITGNEEDRLIVRGHQVFHWGAGGSFLNFLESDLLRELGDGFLEDNRHPLNVWWKAMRAQGRDRHQRGELSGLTSTVAVLNFFTTAHDLFIIADNTKQRDRLMRSLRVKEQFHGARHELMIAACLIRAGFTFEFSDERDSSQRHSDGVALHQKTGRRYSVEMKTKGRAGVLGRPGEKSSIDHTGRDVSRVLRAALSKPAEWERLIFIDMNLPPVSQPSEGLSWQRDAMASIRAVEAQPGKLPAGISSLVVFTNLPANHMAVDDHYVGLETAFTGFNRPDFGCDRKTLGEAYPEIASLFDAFQAHDIMPQTF